jgi:hypothetical protein
MYQELCFYCQPYCQRRGIEGIQGDAICMGISKLLIPKSLLGGQKPIEGSTKSPKAILDDAHASPEGRGPKARVNPSAPDGTLILVGLDQLTVAATRPG